MEYAENTEAVEFFIAQLQCFTSGTSPPAIYTPKFIGAVIGIIAILARNKVNKDLIAKLHGIERIKKLMESHIDHPRIQKSGCWAIGNLVHEGWKAADNKDVIPLLKVAMEKYKDKVGVRIRAWQSLDVYAVEDREVLVEEKGLFGQLIVDMRRFSNNVGFLECGCSAMWCFAYQCPADIEEHIVNKGGIEFLIGLLNRFQDNQEIQECACSVLWNVMSKHPTTKDKVVSSGGIDCVIRLLSVHQENPKVLKSGCGAVQCIVRNSPEHKTTVIQKGGLDLITSAMVKHKNNVHVAVQGCNALKNLAYLPRDDDTFGMDLVARKGGIELIVEIMEIHFDNSRVQRSACSALHHLVYIPVNHKRVLEKGGVKALLKCLNNHSSNSVVFRSACNSLEIMASAVPKEVAKEGVIEQIIEIIKKNMIEAEILEHSIPVLAFLSNDKDNRKLILEADGMETIIEIQAKHGEHAAITTACTSFFVHYKRNQEWLDSGLDQVSKTLMKHKWNTVFGEFGETVLTKIGAKYSMGEDIKSVAPLKNLVCKTIVENPTNFPKEYLSMLPEELMEELSFVTSVAEALEKMIMSKI